MPFIMREIVPKISPLQQTAGAGEPPVVMRAALTARYEAGGGEPPPVMRAEPAQILRMFAPAKGTSATTLEESKYA